MASKKVKKMTTKEFKRVFTECYGDFDVWGYDGVLNLIAMALTYKIEGYERRHSEPHVTALINMESERRKKIWDYLEANGFWEH